MADSAALLEERLRTLVTDALGQHVAQIDWLPGQLGTRRFARIRLEGADPPSVVARIDTTEDPAGRPPGVAPEPALEPIRYLLESHGLPVPRRFGLDAAEGIALLEDVGDVSLREAAGSATRAERHALYTEACDLVPRLQRIGPTDVPAFQRRLDSELFGYKAGLFARYGLALRGSAATDAETRAIQAAFAKISAQVAGAPHRLAHRDFQSANLHVVPGRRPGSRLAMIDLQGAFLAPPEYDLVCLLRDSYVELEAEEVQAQLDRIRPELPDAPEPEGFAARFDLLTLTRKGKDLARFVQAARERGDARFLQYAPASVRALRQAAFRAADRDPDFAALADIVTSLPETTEALPCAE